MGRPTRTQKQTHPPPHPQTPPPPPPKTKTPPPKKPPPNPPNHQKKPPTPQFGLGWGGLVLCVVWVCFLFLFGWGGPKTTTLPPKTKENSVWGWGVFLGSWGCWDFIKKRDQSAYSLLALNKKTLGGKVSRKSLLSLSLPELDCLRKGNIEHRRQARWDPRTRPVSRLRRE